MSKTAKDTDAYSEIVELIRLHKEHDRIHERQDELNARLLPFLKDGQEILVCHNDAVIQINRDGDLVFSEILATVGIFNVKLAPVKEVDELDALDADPIGDFLTDRLNSVNPDVPSPALNYAEVPYACSLDPL